MTGYANEDMVSFEAWKTPFESASVELLDVTYAREMRLVFFVRVLEDGRIYRVEFEKISAFRVLDEHGLLEIWQRTAELKGRSGATTFRVRNHLWSRESPITFSMSDGWSYIVATDFDCIEIVAAHAPEITFEGSDDRMDS